MTFKLATAAAMVLASATASNAADLAKKAPAAVDYVKVCDTYGAGFFYIPGTETCLKLSGYMRAEIYGGDDSFSTSKTYYGNYDGSDDYRAGNALTTRGRVELDLDARSQTELGLLRGFAALRGETNSGGGNSGYIDKAYLQFAGFTAGFATSFWDYVTGASNQFKYGAEEHDDSRNLFAYTFGFGNGVTASVSIEDPTWNARTDDGYSSSNTNTYVGGTLSNALYGGVKAPDVVANINVTQAWGGAQIMGALHQDYGSTVTIGNDWGYAVGAGVKINLPMLGAGDWIGVQAVYTDGALQYASEAASANKAFSVSDFDTTGDTSTAWSVDVNFKHVFSPAWAMGLDFGYVDVDQPNAMVDFKQWDVAGSVTWTPVTNFRVIAGVEYRKTDADAAGLDGDGWVAALQVQRSF